MTHPHPRWMTTVLRLAAVYNIAWGALTVLYPAWLFDLTGLADPLYPFIWQCVGMIVGVYGIGYWIAASDPFRHWPIVLVGFLGKVFGPIGYVQGVFLAGESSAGVPAEFGITLVTNDLIWWVPFAMILWQALDKNQAIEADPNASPEPLETVLAEMRPEGASDEGGSLLERSQGQDILLALVRHAGCPFCKEALADLGRSRSRIEEAGVRPIVVHLGEPGSLDRLMQKNRLANIPRVSDPEQRLYRALEIPRGGFAQLFGLKVWIRGFITTLKGHIVDGLKGDGLQLPGTVIIRDGTVIARHEHKTAADRANFARFACESGSCSITPTGSA